MQRMEVKQFQTAIRDEIIQNDTQITTNRERELIDDNINAILCNNAYNASNSIKNKDNCSNVNKTQLISASLTKGMFQLDIKKTVKSQVQKKSLKNKIHTKLRSRSLESLNNTHINTNTNTNNSLSHVMSNATLQSLSTQASSRNMMLDQETLRQYYQEKMSNILKNGTIISTNNSSHENHKLPL